MLYLLDKGECLNMLAFCYALLGILCSSLLVFFF